MEASMVHLPLTTEGADERPALTEAIHITRTASLSHLRCCRSPRPRRRDEDVRLHRVKASSAIRMTRRDLVV